MSKTHHSQGFTIIELMIATLVFSTVLLLCATGLISIGRMYQKGMTSRAAQETARSVMDQIKNDFELSGGAYKAGSGWFCIGENLYINTGAKVDATGAGGLTVGQPNGGCTDPATPGFTNNRVRQLLGPNMRIADPIISNPVTTNGSVSSVQIRIVIVSGDADLISGSSCKGGAGQEYCASAVLETYATKRLKS